MSLFTTNKPEPRDYILKYSLIYLNMRKVTDEKLDKIRNHEENQ
jgi:hypothetical protein